MSEPSFARTLDGAWRVLRKELLEARRDRNLLLQLVLVPLLLYPTLAFVGIQLVLVTRGAAEKRPALVLLDADTPDPVRVALESESTLRVEEAAPEWSGLDRAPSASDLRARRDDSRADEAGVEVAVAWWSHAGVDSVVLLYDVSREKSKAARSKAWAAIDAHADSLRVTRARVVGLEDDDLNPWRVVTEDVSTAEERGGRILSMILPLMLMLMLPQGLFHASLDTLVGERERGTWETILTSPLDRLQILLGKLGYVVIAGMVTFVLNFAGLMLLVFFALEILLPDAPLAVRLEAGPIAVALLAVLLLTLALAALMMMLAASARSHREGQAALTPAYLVVAFSGFFVRLSDDAFTVSQAAIPLVNVTAMLRAALRGDTPWLPVLVAFVELGLLAAIFLGLASRLVRNEALLFSPEFSLRRALFGGATPAVAERTQAP